MKSLATLFLALFCLQATAQEPDAWSPHYFDGRVVVKRDSLYGFIDRNGVEVIPCQYQKAYNFNDGIAMIRHNYEVFAIDTMGNRLDLKVKIPKFRGRELEGFVSWVWQRIPFASRAEFEELQDEVANVVITIGKDGQITGCEKIGEYRNTAYEKVRNVVMTSPAWSPGEVNGQPQEISYLLPVEFYKLWLPTCYAVDDTGKWLEGDFVFPLFQNSYANNFYSWFFSNLRFKNSAEYQRAASGPVRVAFTIDSKGTVQNIEILRFHNNVCRDKTIQLLKKSPRWTPGTIDGKPVSVRYEMTFNFKFR